MGNLLDVKGRNFYFRFVSKAESFFFQNSLEFNIMTVRNSSKYQLDSVLLIV